MSTATLQKSAGTGSLRVLWLVPAVYFLFVASEFVALTQIAFTLTQRGLSAFSVGLVASAFWVGILLASLVAHQVVKRAGFAGSFIGACALSFLAVISLGLHENYGGWVAGVLVLGGAGGVVWVTGESWLAEAAPAERRGFFVGLFETSVGLGMLSGPVLVLLAQKLEWPVFGVAAALMAACVMASWALRRTPRGAAQTEQLALAEGVQRQPADDPVRSASAASAALPPTWRYVALPLALVAVLGGLLESGSSALLPGVSLRVGFDVTSAAALGALIGAGSALLQAPFGLLADRIGLKRAMAFTWALCWGASVARSTHWL
jgi:MFS family permease